MSEPGDLYHLPATQQIRDPTQTAPRPATRQIRYTLERGERWVSELPTVRVQASLLSLKCVGARVQSSKICQAAIQTFFFLTSFQHFDCGLA